MSRANRRAMRGSARSRRVPARPARGRRLRLPWIPIAVVAGIAILVAGIAYLIIQSGQERSVDNAKWQAVEADANPELPGEFVNLQEIYGGKYGGESPNTNSHVSTEVDYKDKQGLPPVGGSHWGSSRCGGDPADKPAFCGPVDWGVYRQPWDAASLVHNMEHAGVVVWYNTGNQEIIDQLEDFGVDNDEKLLVVAPFPDMEQDTVAITAWGRRDKIPVSEFDRDRLQGFLDRYECRFDPEGIC